MAARIEPARPPYESEVAQDLAKLMPPGMEPIGLFRTVAKNPRVLGRLRRGGLLDPGSIDLRTRELMILRTTALCRAEYEWGVHVAFFAEAAELSEQEVTATVLSNADDWHGREALVVELADALHTSAQVDDALWQRLRRFFDEAQLIELLALAGQYRAVSYLANGSQVELEAGAPRFPQRTDRR
ncbi:MAG: carboxymuconolactone decarboxylase family protein [Myxococcales bacterium]|nr:carboxymuconolactone decarboxylase family protein [Myxococcales bacterium]